MLREVAPDIPVLFLDTVHHFPQTLAYRDEMAARWGLNLVTLRAAEPAPGLWQRDTKACCGGTRSSRSSARSPTTTSGSRGCGASSRRRVRRWRRWSRSGCQTAQLLTQGQPAGRLDDEDVWAYAKAHDIPLLPLYDLGYTSIGCEPCTTLPLDPANAALGALAGPEARVRDSHPGEGVIQGSGIRDQGQRNRERHP